MISRVKRTRHLSSTVDASRTCHHDRPSRPQTEPQQRRPARVPLPPSVGTRYKPCVHPDRLEGPDTFQSRQTRVWKFQLIKLSPTIFFHFFSVVSPSPARGAPCGGGSAWPPRPVNFHPGSTSLIWLRHVARCIRTSGGYNPRSSQLKKGSWPVDPRSDPQFVIHTLPHARWMLIRTHRSERWNKPLMTELRGVQQILWVLNRPINSVNSSSKEQITGFLVSTVGTLTLYGPGGLLTRSTGGPTPVGVRSPLRKNQSDHFRVFFYCAKIM